MESHADQLPLDDRPDALSIAGLYRQVQAAVLAAFPRSHQQWVRGEVQSISDRTGHCYIELVDPEVVRGRETPVLKVNCWGRTWGPLKATLAQQGIVLEPGLIVTLRGRVEFYQPKAQINFIASDVDVSALLGRLAARRAALLAALDAEGLLTRNRGLPVALVPTRVALVGSPQTEGYKDFLGQLRGSGFAFSVAAFPANVQGAGAPASVRRAIAATSDSDCDLVVVVRGGGSRGDLAAFDTEPVARAIATLPLPVWTGIGHTGDQSVADIVANRSFVTPTECGQELVRTVGEWWESIRRAAAVVAGGAARVLEGAATHDVNARRRLGTATRHQLHRHAERLGSRSGRVAWQARRHVEHATIDIHRHAARLGPSARTVCEREHGRVGTWRRLLDAYDVERQLERGYTITMDATGRIVRTTADVAPGTELLTRFADGTARSEVTTVDARPPAPEDEP